MVNIQDNKMIVFDIDKIIQFCSCNHPLKRDDIEITEIFSSDTDIDDLSPIQKQVREIKSNEATAEQAMKYEMVKLMMTYLMDMKNEDFKEFGNQVVLDTMLNNGLIQIKEKHNE